MKETEKVFDPVTGEEVVNTGEEPETPEVEETTPPEETDEGKETPPASEGVKSDVDEFGVPWKNRAMEFQRKFGELQDKVRELEESGKQKEADELEGVLKEMEDSGEPPTPQQLKRMANAIGERVTRNVARTIGPMMASQNVIELQIDRLKQQKDWRPEAEPIMRSKFRQVVPAHLLNDPEGISDEVYNMALGTLARQGKLETKPKPTKRTQTPGAPKIESPGTPPAQRGEKPFTEFEKTEAERMNVTPKQYREIREKREKREKERKEKK